MVKKLFTSESVTCGHPDKVCDQIADRILDELLSQDPESHVACEVTCATDEVHIFGEVTTKAAVDYEDIARQVISQIGARALTLRAARFGLRFTSSLPTLPEGSAVQPKQSSLITAQGIRE